MIRHYSRTNDVTIQHEQRDIVQWGPAPLCFDFYKSNGASPRWTVSLAITLVLSSYQMTLYFFPSKYIKASIFGQYYLL
jgi:hypothetical protein